MIAFEYYQDATDLESAKKFLTALHKAGLVYDPDERADDCLDGATDSDTRSRIQSTMDDAYDAFIEAEEDIHQFILELDPDYLRQVISDYHETIAKIIEDAAGRDFSVDENRELGEALREVAVALKKLAELTIPRDDQGRTREEFIECLREDAKDCDRAGLGRFAETMRDALEWLTTRP